MFDRVVVPVDGSERSLEAVRAGVEIAGGSAARVEAVTVVDPHRDVEAEEEHLREQLASAGLAGTAIAVAVEGDSAADSLRDHVVEVANTLLVMSSTGRGRSVAVLGSVAEELLAAGVGPIVIVGPNASTQNLRSGDVLVTVDGSDMSEHALDVAAGWCVGQPNRVWIVSVVTTVAGAQLDTDVAESGYVRHCAERLQNQLQREVEYEVLHGGSPARAVVEYAESIGAGLIVMATHGRTGLRRMVLGSVAADVIRHAPCPVLVERPSLAANETSRHESVEETTA